MQYIFSVPHTKAGVDSLRFSKVCDEVSVFYIDPPLLAKICDSVDSVLTPTAAGMLKIY